MELRENERRTLLALKKLGGKATLNRLSKVSGLADAAREKDH